MLTQEQVDQYINVSTKIKKLEKEKEALRIPIIEALKAGEACPDSQPYVLELGQQLRCAHEWSEIMEEVLADLGPVTRARAEALIEQMQREKKAVPQLSIKPNNKWLELNQKVA